MVSIGENEVIFFNWLLVVKIILCFIKIGG